MRSFCIREKGSRFFRIVSVYILCAVFYFAWVGHSFGFETSNDVSSTDKERGLAHKQFVYDDHGRRDPFLPLVDANGAIITYEDNLLISDLVLEGIILGAKNDSLAIISGKVLKKGDSIGHFIVLEISAQSVLLGKGNKKFDLKLKKGE